MMESDTKVRYRQLSATEPTLPLFGRAWWLDAVAGASAWDAVVVEKAGKVQAAMPFLLRRRHGFQLSDQPRLTQHLGPWLAPLSGKPASRRATQKDLLGELADRLPAVDHFAQNWHHGQQNWLPFHWRGYRQTTAYTYVLPDLRDEHVLWDGLQANIRTDIKKARDRFGVRVRSDGSLSQFLALNRMVFDRQSMAQPYSEAFIAQVDAACARQAARRIFVAEDTQGRAHAAAYVVWDEGAAYYLMGGSDPALRNSGATSLCLWEAIRFAAGVTRSFDFEGSMLEPVERFFRAFGAEPRPYFRISRTPSSLLRLLHAWRDIRTAT